MSLLPAELVSEEAFCFQSNLFENRLGSSSDMGCLFGQRRNVLLAQIAWKALCFFAQQGTRVCDE